MTVDEQWMQLALAEARLAAAAGEVPVGAVLVKDGALVATGRNAPVGHDDPTAHAEVLALRAAGAALRNYRLDGCELFVTLEPCAMCAGAMLHARLARVVFGAADAKTGAAGSVLDLFGKPQLNHHTQCLGGVLAEECGALLQTFFRDRRSAARESATPLRDDALRTPPERFTPFVDDNLVSYAVSDLPSLRGWRMHYHDVGDGSSGCTVLCLHGPGEWGYFFRHLLGLPGVPGLRRLAPDLIGFGQSDKPKKESVHQLDWHRDVLLEWLDRLDVGALVLIHSESARPLALRLTAAAESRFSAVMLAGDAGEPADAAWRAPFPDRGYEAGLRALGPWPRAASGLTPAQAAQLARDAMGYCGP